MQPNVQAGDSIREGRAEIRVGSAAIAGPPAGIHRELLKVRKPSSLRDERDLAGRPETADFPSRPKSALRSAFGQAANVPPHLTASAF